MIYLQKSIKSDEEEGESRQITPQQQPSVSMVTPEDKKERRRSGHRTSISSAKKKKRRKKKLGICLTNCKYDVGRYSRGIRLVTGN